MPHLVKRDAGPAAGVVAAVGAAIVVCVVFYILRKTFQRTHISKREDSHELPRFANSPHPPARAHLLRGINSVPVSSMVDPVLQPEQLPKYEPPPPPYPGAHVREPHLT